MLARMVFQRAGTPIEKSCFLRPARWLSLIKETQYVPPDRYVGMDRDN